MIKLADFFATMKSSHKTLILLLVLSISTVSVSLAVSGFWVAVGLSALVLALIWLTKPLWAPDKSTPVGSSLAVVSAVALAVLGKQEDSKSIIKTALEKMHVTHATAVQVSSSDRLLSGAVMVFTLVGIYLSARIQSDRSAMGTHPATLDRDFPEQDYRAQRTRFRKILRERLERLDEETKWDDFLFAPLEAEVEINSRRFTSRKVVNLMKALRTERRSNLVLVLGDPGAGKSVALRKLARELLDEVDSTNRVPVYVNLKEWALSSHSPTVLSLRSFILDTLKGQNVFADKFITTYFDRMFDRGHFFFILDSFDEIPSVLDVSEASSLVEQLSLVIVDFFASQDGGRGVISSRFYRRPRFPKTGTSVLEIRPFSDLQIHRALTQSGQIPNATLDKLFSARPELIPVARNPFAAALLRMYAESHFGELPATQLQMYESYVHSRLMSSSEKIAENGLTDSIVLHGATAIAWAMFSAPNIGLEATVGDLELLVPDYPIGPITNVLRYSALARVSSATNPRFSFVHRRLNEYFVARRLVDEPGSVSLEAIPTDSRYRDALALYCEVGDLAHVRRIADFCWQRIERGAAAIHDLRVRVETVHCLRFLRDAFSVRTEALSHRDQIAHFISQRLNPVSDLLDAKIALEATGLITEEKASEVFVAAFKADNVWLSEVALRACRNLETIGPDLERMLKRYLRGFRVADVVRRAREIDFSLSLSDAFRGIRRLWRIRCWDAKILLIGLVILTFVSPAGVAVVLLGWAVTIRARDLISPFTHESFWRINGLASVSFSVAIAAHLVVIHRGHDSYLVDPVGVLFSHHRFAISSVLRMVLILMIFPLWEVFFVKTDWFRSSIALLTAMIPLIFALALHHYFPEIAHKIFVAGEWTLGAIGLVVLIFVGCRGAIWMRRWFRDRRLFSKVTQSSSLDRPLIADYFLRLRTEWFREKFVEWLESLTATPLGDWPSGRPNDKNSRSSAMLAQLDERWLGLDT